MINNFAQCAKSGPSFGSLGEKNESFSLYYDAEKKIQTYN